MHFFEKKSPICVIIAKVANLATFTKITVLATFEKKIEIFFKSETFRQLQKSQICQIWVPRQPRASPGMSNNSPTKVQFESVDLFLNGDSRRKTPINFLCGLIWRP